MHEVSATDSKSSDSVPVISLVAKLLATTGSDTSSEQAGQQATEAHARVVDIGALVLGFEHRIRLLVMQRTVLSADPAQFSAASAPAPTAK